MSPASQGALEVERYIGSCLISSTGRSLGGCRKQELQQHQRTPKQQCQFGPVGTWAGGAPLISMAPNARRNSGQRLSPGQQQQQQQQPINHQEQQHPHGRVPLSRLAVHTQGAPLILSGRFHNNRAKLHGSQAINAITNCVAGLLNGGGTGQQNNISNATRCHPSTRLNNKPAMTPVDPKKPAGTVKPADGSSKDASSGTTANIDSLSIASDESSGSNNSENSLPRIIKPRKRRKKDRKPPPVVNVVNPASAAPTTNDMTKAAAATPDEVQQHSPLVNSSTLLTAGVPEPQQPQQQQQQLKPYQANSYDGPRYPADNYYKGHRRPMNNGNPRENAYRHNGSGPTNSSTNGSNQQLEVVDTRQQQQRGSGGGYAAHRHVQVKVLDDNRNVILPHPVCQAKAAAATTGYLRHGNNNCVAARFLHEHSEPVALDDVNGSGIDDCLHQGSLCQCHYCDPATLVWDVADQNGFAAQYLGPSTPADYNGPHHRHQHHHHHHRYSQVPVFLATRPFVCQEHANAGIEFYDNNSCLRFRATSDRPDGAILRRSWSDPTSYFSDEILPNRDVGVIGDRGGAGQSGESSSKTRSCWRADASIALSSSPTNRPASPASNGSANGSPAAALQGPLEVSTEIVTSPNGHRDLEIKFYSSSPTTTTSYAVGKSAGAGGFGCFPELDDESDESADIWSYHESKLQQDFRTLLQAEE